MTEALRARDLRTVLDVAWTIGEAESLDAYRDVVLATAPRLVTGEVYGYNEVPPHRGEPLVNMNVTPSEETWREGLTRLAEEHPLVVHFLATGDPEVRAISDLMSRRAFEGGEFYRDVLSHVSGRDQLAVSMSGRDGLVIGLAVNRSRRGFSARDHAMYAAIRPFLVQGYRTASLREHERAVLAALESTTDAVEQPVLLVSRRGRVEHLTPGAADLLGDAAPLEGATLPDPLARWLRAQRERPVPEPLVADGWSARLIRRAGTGLDAIVLSAGERALSVRALRTIGLTRREADVLSLVAGGGSNAAVAHTLGIAEATVAKHLQHVNEKLGVTSRTAAVARARALVLGAN